jgi:hypothetical protein
MDTQHDEDDPQVAGDLLVGASAIRDYLVFLGMPDDTDVYYLRRTGRWPIGSDGGGRLIASKRRLARHTQKIAATKVTAAHNTA